VYDNLISTRISLNSVKREGYGGNNKEVDLQYSLGKDKGELKYNVKPRQYSDEEIGQILGNQMDKILDSIKGKNTSLDKVRYKLNLEKTFANGAIEAAYQISDPKIVDSNGKIHNEGLDGGQDIKINVTLSYKENPKINATREIQIKVLPKILTEKEKSMKEVKSAIADKDKETKEDGVFTLPKEIEGKKIIFNRLGNMRGLYLLFVSFLVICLLIAREKEGKKEAEKKRKEELILAYPDIISKFSMLILTGMSVSNIWRKIVNDEKKNNRKVSLAYKEMEKTLREIDSNFPEGQCYERFGKRCNTREYIKFGGLLSLNLRKGNRGLGTLLTNELYQSLEDKKARIRRKAEEAGTKLLFPMFLMLIVVLIIVVVPAFLSVEI
jgi:hypothetical protein